MADLLFHSVEGPLDPALTTIELLYETAFPREQRRDFEDLLSLIGRDKFHLEAVRDGDATVGLVAWWRFEGFVFVEHLAIEAPLRGRRYGTGIIERLKTIARNVVAEVAFPHDEESNRTILSAEKLGFRVLPYRYAQPPYRKGDRPVYMHFLSLKAVPSMVIFLQIKAIIYREVYGKEG